LSQRSPYGDSSPGAGAVHHIKTRIRLFGAYVSFHQLQTCRCIGSRAIAATDSSNTQWQRDLSVSYDDVGDVLVAQGKLDEALKAYRDGFAIREHVAAADPNNTQWQRDLAVSHSKLASVYERQGRIADALVELTKGQDIIVALLAIVPGHAQWKKDLAWVEQQIARLQGQARAQ